ncbi:GNAT family acetyltransferase [Sphingomonas turrisvirgatae]|uniref:GNAT family N-acetyltransferase n=1 Tax=Sphingomonas turrisvirgatae TaxID=1888892 RepID=A0A1E3LX48_9SPHN|nr:GNAT family acetyltransferase [Sphingomonas turrisvirgatae]ODP38299.1 GNAT family N-acetyltransferase [Sphingomonas turrisvirgatae]
MSRIRSYDDAHFAQVAALWRRVFPEDAPHSQPEIAIPAKIAMQRDLFLVALEGERVAGTILAGYDGHRGWLYKLAVDHNARRCGIGTHLVRTTEARLADLGCVKINLQVRLSNEAVAGFWRALGYEVEPIVSMGKRL